MKKILMMFALSLCLFACEDKVEEVVKLPEGEPFSHSQIWKSSFSNQADGWIYEATIISDKIDSTSEKVSGNYDLSKSYNFYFSGFNLKTRELGSDGKVIINKETGNEEGTYTQVLPTLSYYDEYAAEIKVINAFFNEKKFLEPIQIEDLSGLQVSLIDPTIIVAMYNEALANEPEAFGAFAFIPRAAMNHQVVNESETWQGGYIIGYGEIAVSQFEIITPYGIVSDMVHAFTASEEQIQLQANLDQLEQAILDTQVFTKDNIHWSYPDVMSEERLQAIDNILEKQYNGEQFEDKK